MRRLALVVALALALAACGGTDWNSAQGPGGSAKAARTAARKQAAAAERPYVDAMVAGAAAQSDGTTPAMARCVATAIVHGYGTKAFASAGFTPKKLRDPNVDLAGLPAPTSEQVSTIGGALQHCGVGTSVATGELDDLSAQSPGEVKCLGDHVDHDTRARRLLVYGALGRDLDDRTAHDTVSLLAACVDLPTLFLDASNLPIDEATRACMLTELRGAHTALEDYIALRLAGGDPESTAEADGTISIAINRCRPGARTGFTVPSD